jgi:hypothetical protein
MGKSQRIELIFTVCVGKKNSLRLNFFPHTHRNNAEQGLKELSAGPAFNIKK